MTTQSITSITDGQKKQYLRFVEDAAERALKEVGLDKDGIQKLIENGNEFQARIITSIEELSVSNQFAGEEAESSYAYPRGYTQKRLDEQLALLREMLPELGPTASVLFSSLPPHAEGWFAIPKWQTLAPTYGEAVEKVLAMIASKRKFYNYRAGQLGAEYLRQNARTTKMLQRLGKEQKDHNILVVPAQFGLRHRGRSVHRAREVFAANEFGLGAFAVGIMLLTHSERLVQWEQLHVDCAGDEFAPDADRRFDFSPFFDVNDGQLEFDTVSTGCALAGCGSASGFLSSAVTHREWR